MSRAVAWLFGCVALGTLVGAVAAADPWDPLRERPTDLALFAGAFGLGLLIGGRAAYLALLAVTPLFWLDPSVSGGGLGVIGVGAFLVFGGGLVLVGWLIRRRIGGRWPRVTGGVLLVAPLALAINGLAADMRVIDVQPQHPRLIDDRDGSFRGIRPGDELWRMSQILGRPATVRRPDGPFPSEPSEYSRLAPPEADMTSYDYGDLVVFSRGGAIEGFRITADGAQTSVGVGIGDSIDLVEQRYPRFLCEDVTLGSHGGGPDYPECSGGIGGSARLIFRWDPIGEIEALARRDLDTPE